MPIWLVFTNQSTYKKIMVDVSVVVPFYGVEKYIERCALSLLKQTHTNIEIIFVNDCTKDNSQQLLNETIAKNNHNHIPIKIIQHEVNRGISAARQTGTTHTNGKYLLYVDSDDYVADNMVELLYQCAEHNQSDIVVCDYFLLKNGMVSRIHQTNEKLTANDYLHQMLLQRLDWTPWNKLISRELVHRNDISWPEGINMAEDLLFITKVFTLASKLNYVPKPLYFYNRDNVNSLINSISVKACNQSYTAVQETIAFIKQKGLYKILESGVMQIILMLKFNMLYTKNPDFIQALPDIYPESNSAILSYKNAGLHWRLLMYLISKRWFWFYKHLSHLIKILVSLKKIYISKTQSK